MKVNWKTGYTMPIVAAITLALSACSSNDDSSDNDGVEDTSMLAPGSPPPAAPSTALNGSWTSGCVLADAEFPEEGFSVTNLTINGDTAQTSLFNYTDSACTQPDIPAEVQLESSIAYPNGTVSTPRGEAIFVDVTIESVTFDGQAPSGELLTQLQGNDFFAVDYGIAVVGDDGLLYFGDATIENQNGTTPETRSITLDTSEALTRL